MKTKDLKKYLKPASRCGVPILLLAVAACDSDGNLPSDINISIDSSPTTDTGEPTDDSPAVAEARALLAGLEADGGNLSTHRNSTFLYPVSPGLI